MRRIFMPLPHLHSDRRGSVAYAYPLVQAFVLRYAGKYTKICVVLHAVSSVLLPGRCLMAANDHQTYIYVGLAGEGQYMADGGPYCFAGKKGRREGVRDSAPPRATGKGRV